jgi:hypothetical protein
MRSTEELVRDHEVILGVLDGLEAHAEALEGGGPLDVGYLRDAVASAKGSWTGATTGRRSTVCFRAWSGGGCRGKAAPSG